MTSVMQPKVAAITMVYNEAALLPVWARHYARQVGADHCYVVDHGSTEPIILPPGVNTLRLPRSPHDDARRARFISGLAASLLGYYDWVLYTDVDELLLADPAEFADLQSFCGRAGADTINAIGLDIQHRPALEPPLDLVAPIGAQRGWVRFTSAMCKPVLTRTPIAWTPGFHASDQPIAFAGLFLFHLHWADQTLGRHRLAKTRLMPWGSSDAGQHQRMNEGDWQVLFQGMAELPAQQCVPFDPDVAPLRNWIEATTASARRNTVNPHSFDLDVNAPELWPIPPHFRARL